MERKRIDDLDIFFEFIVPGDNNIAYIKRNAFLFSDERISSCLFKMQMNNIISINKQRKTFYIKPSMHKAIRFIVNTDFSNSMEEFENKGLDGITNGNFKKMVSGIAKEIKDQTNMFSKLSLCLEHALNTSFSSEEIGGLMMYV